MKLRFFQEIDPGFDIRSDFSRIGRIIETIVGPKTGDLNIILSDDARLKLLNSQYRHISKTTDVLSFIYDDFEDLYGEIYISAETARRQAKKQGHSLKKELHTLFTHGLLHIRGYDHEDERDYRVMKLLEEKTLDVFYKKEK